MFQCRKFYVCALVGELIKWLNCWSCSWINFTHLCPSKILPTINVNPTFPFSHPEHIEKNLNYISSIYSTRICSNVITIPNKIHHVSKALLPKCFRNVVYLAGYYYEKRNKLLYMLVMLLMYSHFQNSICYKKILGYCFCHFSKNTYFFSILIGLSLVDYS